MGRRKTEQEREARRAQRSVASKVARKQRLVASRRRMTPMKALTPTRGIDPPEPGTQGADPDRNPTGYGEA